MGYSVLEKGKTDMGSLSGRSPPLEKKKSYERDFFDFADDIL